MKRYVLLVGSILVGSVLGLAHLAFAISGLPISVATVWVDDSGSAGREAVRIPLHRIAFIEKAGTGIRRMRDDARAHRCPSPVFAEGTFFTVTFRPNRAARAATAAASAQPGSTPQVTRQVTPQVRAVLVRAASASTRDDLQKAAGIGDREHFRTRYMLPLLAAGWLAMTIPHKPRSSKQRYLVTPEGEDALPASSPVANDEER
jgi:hypothetical protein